ncbi:MAG: AraC family transcriptional regulator [Alphaproteobacteria bacterium]|nr:AraC family transcriptional regulator [Alphaproteobacteria bacterium]
MTELVRVAALTGYFETMAGFGIDPRALLSAQGLSANMLVNPEHLIPASATIRLLERSAEVTGCITFGLRMAEGRVLANLGATSLLIAHQPTLRKALATLAEFRARINSTLVLQMEEIDGQAILREDFSLRRPEPSRQASNLALGVLARLCASALGENWRPLTVCFRHEAPPTSELPIFTRLFRCRPEFDCEFDGIVLDANELDRPNPKSDSQLAAHARQLIDSVMNPAERTTAEDVDQLIKVLLPSGRATIQICAASMGVTVRTLQRMLDAEGACFTELLNRARMQMATQYVRNHRMRVTDIAQMLGYSSIGAFTRWHVQAFGEPPLKARKGAG